MDYLQWVIPIIITILSILIVREQKNQERKNEKDKELLAKITSTIGACIDYINRTDWGGYYDTKHIQGLSDFLLLCRQPEFFFINNKLEINRKALFESAKKLSVKLRTETFALDETTYSIPRPLEYKGNLNWEDLRESLNATADEVIKDYEILAKNGRLIL